MLRQGCRVVVALLAFVAFAGSAAAECAWVLRSEEHSAGGNLMAHSVLSAHDTRADCQRALDTTLADWRSGKTGARDRPSSTVRVDEAGRVLLSGRRPGRIAAGSSLSASPTPWTCVAR